MVRRSEKSLSSTPALGRPKASGNTGSSGGRSRPIPAEELDRRRVWGKTPKAATNQSDMIRLFERQNELKAHLRRQARLAKLAVAEVRSTEAEQLRMVNQALLDVSSSVKGFSNPFAQRNLTHAQRVAEDMIRRQGQKVITGPVIPNQTPTSPGRLYSRRKWCAESVNDSSSLPSTKKIFLLGGPLARSYRRAVERGYLGSPESWIRSARAVEIASKLSRKGFTFPATERWSVSDFRSPLYWVVNCHSGIAAHNLRHGFQGERLRTEVTNFGVLRRQAASVQRLKSSLWPCVPGTHDYAWPTYPTLNESWTMMRRKKLPIHRYIDPIRSNLIRSDKVPTKQVKPGSSVKVVRQFVIGIRADIEVPRKFLAYFRYRWGFLILHRKSRLPNPLVRWLVNQWKSDISGLFLKYPCRYNDALRRLPAIRYYRMVGFVPAGQTPRHPGRRTRCRKGRHERLRDKINAAGFQPVKDCEGTPLSDKSSGGVRLC